MKDLCKSSQQLRNKEVKVLLIARYAPGQIGGGQAKFAEYLMESLSGRVSMFNVSIPHNVGLSRGKRLWQALKIFKSALKLSWKEKIGVAHIFAAPNRTAFYEKLLLALILKSIGVKVIINFRGAFDKHHKSWTKLERVVIKHLMSDRFFFLCQHKKMANYLDSDCFKIARDKVAVIYNGIEIASEAPVERSIIKRTIKFTYAGSLSRAKGFFVILDAVKELVSRGVNDFELHLFGHWEVEQEKQSALRFIDENNLNNFFSFAGNVSREVLHKHFHSMDVLLLPSYEEGFPNIILEAFNTGVVVASTDVGAIPEIILDKSNGLLFSPGDANRLSDIMMSIIDEPRNLTVLQATAWHQLPRFSLKQSLNNYEDIYLKL